MERPLRANSEMVDTAMIRLSVAALPDNRIRFAFFEALPPTAATIADEAVRLFGERLHLAPQDILFVFSEVEPNLPRFPATSIRRDPTADA
jgi:hypothetical protein